MTDDLKKCFEYIGLTEEDVAAMEHGPTTEQALEHFGSQPKDGCWYGKWFNKPNQLKHLAELPEIMEQFGLDERFHIVFDYDPNYPVMLLQFKVTKPDQK